MPLAPCPGRTFRSSPSKSRPSSCGPSCACSFGHVPRRPGGRPRDAQGSAGKAAKRPEMPSALQPVSQFARQIPRATSNATPWRRTSRSVHPAPSPRPRPAWSGRCTTAATTGMLRSSARRPRREAPSCRAARSVPHRRRTAKPGAAASTSNASGCGRTPARSASGSPARTRRRRGRPRDRSATRCKARGRRRAFHSARRRFVRRRLWVACLAELGQAGVRQLVDGRSADQQAGPSGLNVLVARDRPNHASERLPSTPERLRLRTPTRCSRDWEQRRPH